MTAFAPQYLIKIVALLLLFSLPQGGHAASQKMMWVLASFAEADLAAKEADRVSELTGQITAVQTARVGQGMWHRVLITPAIDSGSEARLTSLLKSINYEQTWRVWLGEADVSRVVWYGGQPTDYPDPLDTSVSDPEEWTDSAPMVADLDGLLDDPSVAMSSSSTQVGVSAGTGQAVEQLLAPDVDYHPIRLRAPR